MKLKELFDILLLDEWVTLVDGHEFSILYDGVRSGAPEELREYKVDLVTAKDNKIDIHLLEW